MNDFLTKFENFIFDVMGLIFPGLIFLLLISIPPMLFDFSSLKSGEVNNSILLSTLSILLKGVKKLYSIDKNYSIALVLITSYIVGHVIKVLSVIAYDFLAAVFDNSINKWISLLCLRLLRSVVSMVKRIPKSDVYLKPVYDLAKVLFSPIKSVILKIITFRSPDFFSSNDILRTKSIELINSKLKTNFPDKWYSLFKLSVAINAQENLKSLSGNFLSKYNMYRSLAFIFGAAFAYFLVLYDIVGPLIPKYISNLRTPVLLCLGVLCFTFHQKYKRYWTLCGNETLVSIFYFLHKKELNS
jgi:hypothetical protein